MDRLPANDPRFDEIIFTSEEIASRIREMAAEIHRDFGDSEGVLLVGILKGVAPFQTDLARALSVDGMIHLRMGFLRASTYGSGIKSDGEKERKVDIVWLGMPKDAKNILLLDDVLDQGFTLSAVKTALQERYPNANVRTAVMLSTQVENATEEVRKLRSTFQPDYVGFQAPDRWIVGSGLDIAEDFRELPYIATVYEKYFM